MGLIFRSQVLLPDAGNREPACLTGLERTFLLLIFLFLGLQRLTLGLTDPETLLQKPSLHRAFQS